MDEDLKKSLEEVKNMVREGKKDEALSVVNELLSKDEFKPYENALKKIKVDIIYALNLERINPDLGKKAYDKVATELDSAVSGQKPEAPQVSTKPSSKPNQTPQKPLPITSAPPLPVFPVVAFRLPPDIVNKDPYDVEHLDITDEIGPFGMLNDFKRTIISLSDPLLPLKMLKKEVKKKS